MVVKVTSLVIVWDFTRPIIFTQWRMNNVCKIFFDLTSVTLLSCFLFSLSLFLHPAGFPLLDQLSYPVAFHPFRSVSLDFRAETLIIIQSVGVLINSRCETTWKRRLCCTIKQLKVSANSRGRWWERKGIINDSWRGECREMTSGRYPGHTLWRIPS